ncbi:14806_t:CDS:2 [Funneliformis caledonium]|uniref:14806_t:CDS:1 n=1 Tax=Funneliformis caledonium TaxID=1117310 RepID=A0A9N9BZ64_9GLOM|nr:14806_t:CDS:2 [Funneliformis caledonium]
MKVAPNIALDWGCEDEMIYMLNGFIDRKKVSVEDVNYEKVEVSDPVVQKRCEDHHRNELNQHQRVYIIEELLGAINPLDPNLHVYANEELDGEVTNKNNSKRNICAMYVENVVITPGNVPSSKATS